jgi:hypothetical protein
VGGIRIFHISDHISIICCIGSLPFSSSIARGVDELIKVAKCEKDKTNNDS